MAGYSFLSTWCLEAPIADVFEALRAAREYPAWWRGVEDVRLLEDAGNGRVGDVNRFSWRSRLPYTLTFDARVTALERPHLIAGDAAGALEGTGVWRLYESAAGTCAVYDWRVRVNKRWMNALGPLGRPAFIWNHDWVMRQGAHGLARLLDARLVACD